MTKSIPCKTCITKMICKYKKRISCSLLNETLVEYLEKHSFAGATRRMRLVLSYHFEWNPKRTMVWFVDNAVMVEDSTIIPRIER